MTLVCVTLVRVRRAEGLMRAHEAACETLCGTWTEGGPCRAMRGGPRRAASGMTLFRFLRGGGGRGGDHVHGPHSRSCMCLLEVLVLVSSLRCG